MNFELKVEKELLKLADEKYLEFSKDIAVGKDDIKQIGIRIPILRKFAKYLNKNYELEYLLENINENYYEEIMLKGMLICENKNLEWNEIEKYIKYYVPKIFDWALCDVFCSRLKITKKYKKQMWEMINEYIKSKQEFEIRFGLVILLNYYIEEAYIHKIFEIINEITLDKYYVKMANAWLIAECLAIYYDKTLNFLKNNCTLDKWTYNKAIQKGIESYRIEKEEKETLRKLKK